MGKAFKKLFARNQLATSKTKDERFTGIEMKNLYKKILIGNKETGKF